MIKGGEELPNPLEDGIKGSGLLVFLGYFIVESLIALILVPPAVSTTPSARKNREDVSQALRNQMMEMWPLFFV